jgi:hypothetical protein
VFTEYMLAHWAGCDFSRPLTERREQLFLAIELREALGLAPRQRRKRGPDGRFRQIADPLASELERVERQMGIAA